MYHSFVRVIVVLLMTSSLLYVSPLIASGLPPNLTNPGAQTNHENEPVSNQLAASDPEGDALTFTVSNLPPGLSMSTTGLITGRIAFTAAAASPYNVTVRVSDGTSRTTATFSWTVIDVNRAPVVTLPADQDNSEGDSVSLQITATDEDGDSVIFTATNLPPGLQISDAGLISGTLSETAAQDSPYDVTVTASDGKDASAPRPFRWTVQVVNQPPVFTALEDRTDPEGATISLQVQAQDPDGDAITFTATDLPPGVGMTSSGLISGVIAFTAAPSYTVRITASDADNATAATTFTWNVTPVNRAPTIVIPAAQSNREGDTIALPVRADDPDGDNLHLSAVNLPPGLQIEPTTGVITGTILSTAATSSPYPVTITATDDGSPELSADAMFAWTVTPALITLTTPRAGDVIAGRAVSIAALTVPQDTTSMLAQWRPVGESMWHDIAATDLPPFVVSWDTTAVEDTPVEIRAVVNLSSGSAVFAPPIEVIVANMAPADLVDIVEDMGKKTQGLRAGEEMVAVTGDGAIVSMPAAALPADDRLTIEVLPERDAPGKVPGDVAGLLADVQLASGLDTLQAPMTLFLPYADVDQDGLVDGTSFLESMLTVWFFDTDRAAWVPLPQAMLHPDTNVIEVQEDRLGVYSVVHLGDVPPPLTLALGGSGTVGRDPVTLSGNVQNRLLLPIRLDAGAELITLNHVTVAFVNVTGNEALATRLKVRLSYDANGNGQVDASDTVLGTANVTNVVTPLTLTVTPQRLLDAFSSNNVLLTVDSNPNRAQAASAAGWPTRMASLPWLLSGVLVPLLGLVISPRVSHKLPRASRYVLVLLLCGSLLWGGCSGGGGGDDDDGDDQPAVESLVFTVVIPPNGISADGSTSGAFTLPQTTLTGPQVTVVP